MPAPAAVVAPTAPTPLAWRGTLFFATLSMNLNVLDPSLQLSQNPTVDGTLSIRPRYFLNAQFQLRAGANLYYEFTNSDSTTTINEPRFSDTFFDLWYHGIPTIGPLKIWVAPRIIVPTSAESIARTMIFTPALVSQFAVSAEHVLGGEFSLIGNVTYSHPIYQYTTPGLRAAPAYRPQCYGLGGDSCGLQVSGLPNSSDSVFWSVIVAQDWGWISPGLYFAMSHSWGYPLAATPDVPHIENPQNVRQSTTFGAWVDFVPTPYLALEVGYTMTRNVLDANGQYGNPIFSQYQDMRLYLQTIVTLDRLYEAVFVHQRTAGGVLRTQNEPRRSRAAGILF